MPELVIGGIIFEFVDSWPHLGHIVTSSNDNYLDILKLCCGQLDAILLFVFCLGYVIKLRVLKFCIVASMI